MLREFIKVYNLPEGSVFKRDELEDELIAKFGNLTYNKYGGWKDNKTGKDFPTRYAINIKVASNLYGIDSYTIDNKHTAYSVTEALILLFIKYGAEPDKESDRYFTDNYFKEFHDIVNIVYN